MIHWHFISHFTSSVFRHVSGTALFNNMYNDQILISDVQVIEYKSLLGEWWYVITTLYTYVYRSVPEDVLKRLIVVLSRKFTL